MRPITTLLRVLVVAMLVAACGTEASSSGGTPTTASSDKIDLSTVTLDPNNPVTIEYWHYFTDNRGRPNILQWIDEFQAEHPEIRVVEKYNESPDLLANIQAAVAAGTPPDVVVSTSKSYLIDYLDAVPVDAFAIDDSFWADYYPNVLEFGQLDGRQVSVPYAFSTSLFYYNADLFRAAGLDPDRPPTTMAELRDAARQIKERTGKWGYYSLPYLGWPIQMPIIVNGGSLLDADGRAAFASPAGEEAFQFFYDMATKDQVIPYGTRQELDQAFLSGNIAMYIGTSATINNFRQNAQFEVRSAKVPAFDGVPLQAPNGGSNLMILTHDAQKQKAAWEWIQFISAPERLSEWVQATGYLPPKQGILDNPDLLQPFVDSDPLFQGAVAMLPNTIQLPEWPGQNTVEIENLFVKLWDRVMTGDVTDPVAALHDLQDQVNGLLP